jgi:uncharacterized membrane protein
VEVVLAAAAASVVADFQAVAVASAAAARLGGGDMKFKRIFIHLCTPPWLLRRQLQRGTLQRIEAAIAASERTHHGELRLVMEAVLPWRDVLAGVSARERAIEIFSQERVWDTEHNSGVLVYLLLADRDIEIVADRGIHARVGEAGWAAICAAMERRLHAGDFEAGILDGLQTIGALLDRHFPANLQDNPDELENRPLML